MKEENVVMDRSFINTCGTLLQQRLIMAAVISMLLEVTAACGQSDTQGAQSPSLIGCWICQSEEGTSQIEFRADGIMIADGELSQYVLKADAISVDTEWGMLDYGYKLKGNALVIVLPGDFRLPCSRVKCDAGADSAPDDKETGSGINQRQPALEKQTVTNEHLLRGTFCHWSGSSSSYSGSSYSHSIRVTFDGQGHFATGSESSFNNPSGLGYGQGDGASGTYRIVGREVHLRFNDGSEGVAAVYNSAADGTITELMYNGDLYAPQLCD